MGSKVAETIEESVSYRTAMSIEEILVCPGSMYDFKKKYTYPICPRCGACIEYDYQRFCGGCGQKLNWKGYSKANLRYAGGKEPLR